MLLKPDTSQNIISKLKSKYFTYQQCLVNSKDQYTSMVTFLIEMLYFIPTVSIFFKSEVLNEPLINKFFLCLHWQDFHTLFNMSEILTLGIMSIWFFTLLSATIYTYNVQKPNSFSSRMMTYFLSMIAYFVVPYTALHLTVLLNQYPQPIYVVFKVIAGLSLTIGTVLTVMFLKLKIKPLRKDNLNWSVTNQFQFNRFFLNFIRTLVFIIDGISVGSLIVSTALQYFLRVNITKFYRKQYLAEIQTSSNLTIITHLAFLIYNFTQYDSQLSVIFLEICWFIFIMKGCYDYFNQMNKPLQFPLCSSNPYEFYDFYYRFCSKYDEKNVSNEYESNENFYFSTMKEHSRKCNDKRCPLSGVCLMKKNIIPQVENFISEILRRQLKINYSPELQILEEFWKLEAGKKFLFREKTRHLDLQSQYRIFTVQNSEIGRSDYGLESSSSDSTLQQLNNIFLDQLMVILHSFSEFYGELLKSKPKLETITGYGEKMRTKGEQIQDMYIDLLKKKAISFKAIELYLQFETYFLKVNSLNYDLLKKIISIQKNINTDDIQCIYLPAMTVYSESGLVENANMESISFLKYNRFELKSKLIKDVVYPPFKYENYFKLNEQEIENSLMFIKKKHGDFACGNIKINTKFINNKKFYIYIFQKKRKAEGVNFILLDEEKFEIANIVTQTEILKEKRHPQIMATINWRDVFENYIKKSKRELKLTKLIKLDLKEYNCILMCSLSRTFNQSFSVLSLKMMRNVKEVTHDRRSIIKRQSPNVQVSLNKFNFIYDLNDEKVTKIKGYRKDVNAVRQQIRKYHSSLLDPFTLTMRTELVDFTLVKNRNYKNGIKTYRLYGHDLYNIDLEDKEAYIEQFDGLRSQTDIQDRQVKKPVDIYVIALVVGISLLLTAMSVFMLYSLNQNMTSISNDFSISNEMDRFKINFYRIAAMLRDVASGLYDEVGRQWVPDVMESYNLIKQNQNKKMFSNDQVAITYAGNDYTGNLNELIQVILSEVFTLTKTKQLQIIQDIHNTVILELSFMIEYEQDAVSDRISERLSQFISLKNYLGLGIVFGIIFFYLLMIYLCYNLVVTLKHNMKELMLTSDHQAREGQENAQKLIYAIDMIRKNFQVDIKHLLFERRRFRKRRRSKQTIVGFNIKLIVCMIIVFFLLVNVFVILMFNVLIQKNFKDFVIMKTHGENILAIYSDLCKEANYIDHTGTINPENIFHLRQQLFVFQKSVTQLIFSEQTNNDIVTYFLEESCNLLSDRNYFKNESQLTCDITTPSYEIENPFKVGLLMYFTRVHYNLVENITDAYGCTGIYSIIFSKVFSELSREISTDVSNKVNKFIFQASLYSIFLIFVNVVYCLAAIFLSLFIKRKNQSLDKLIKFLNLRTQTAAPRQKKKENLTSEQTLEGVRRQSKRLSLLQQSLH